MELKIVALLYGVFFVVVLLLKGPVSKRQSVFVFEINYSIEKWWEVPSSLNCFVQCIIPSQVFYGMVLIAVSGLALKCFKP